MSRCIECMAALPDRLGGRKFCDVFCRRRHRTNQARIARGETHCVCCGTRLDPGSGRKKFCADCFPVINGARLTAEYFQAQDPCADLCRGWQ